MKRKIFLLYALLSSYSAFSAVVNTVLTDSSRVYDLDEVVVVAQAKESFRLRQQPLSSTVVSGDDMVVNGLHDLRSLSSRVPSFVMPEYGSRLTSSIYIRGIGSRVNSPSMGVYLDQMPLMNKTAFNTHIYQIDRVDVLRGPQGTLYGMNTEGGMLRVFTKSPFHGEGTDLKVGLGTALQRNVELAHYHRLSDQLAFSVAAFYQGSNGFFRNTLTGEHADRMNEAGGRIRLMARPTARLTIDWTSDYQYVRQHANPYGVYHLDNGHVDLPCQDTQSRYQRHMLNNGLGLRYEGRGYELQSYTSWQFLRDRLLMDNDYSPIDFIVVDQYQLSNTLTEELTMKSRNRSRWHWAHGVFASHQWLKTTAPNTFGEAFSQQMSQQIGSMIYNQIFRSMADRMGETAAAAMIERAGGVSVGMTLQVPSLFHTPQTNVGIYHESNIELSKHLTATLGLRYDHTHSRIDYDAVGLSALDFNIMGSSARVNMSSVFQRTERLSTDQLLPKAALTWKLKNGSNVYATVTKGYRSGGFNIQLFGDIIQNDVQRNLRSAMQEAMQNRKDMDIVIRHTDEEYEALLDGIRFKPEESWNYELGTHLNLFGGALHADASLYYMQIRNQQLSVFTSDYGYGRKMVNAGRSFSCGAEVALRGSALDNHLTWSATYGYTHAAFKDYKTRDNATDTEIDYKDKRVPFVPEHTFSMMADYRFDLHHSDFKSLVIGANVNGQGRTWWDEANTFDQKFYAMAGAHVGVEMPHCTFNLWARNITNAHYNTFAFMNKATGQPVYHAQRGNPFQMGAELSFRF